MFKRLRSWLTGIATPDTPETLPPAGHRLPPSDTEVEVPAEAIELARRLLRICLETFEAAERIPDISDMRIAPYRFLVECLPLRVYVYALGSFMADMDFESILESNRPVGAVFDAFELRVGDVRCGFYVYSLQPFSNRSILNSLWQRLRKEAGESAKTADLPQIHICHHVPAFTPATDATRKIHSRSTEDLPMFDTSSVRMMPLDGDPEVIVQSLVGQELPSQQLATYQLTASEEIMKPIFAFALTRNEYPFEREELIDFVRRTAARMRLM